MTKKQSSESVDKSRTKQTAEGRQKYDVSPEAFIEAWQRADSAEEVAEKLGMPKGIVHARASNYRMIGIRLKKMPRRPKNKVDVASMNKLIDQINRELREGT
jgi:hypothetical protein